MPIGHFKANYIKVSLQHRQKEARDVLRTLVLLPVEDQFSLTRRCVHWKICPAEFADLVTYGNLLFELSLLPFRTDEDDSSSLIRLQGDVKSLKSRPQKLVSCSDCTYKGIQWDIYLDAILETFNSFIYSHVMEIESTIRAVT